MVAVFFIVRYPIVVSLFPSMLYGILSVVLHIAPYHKETRHYHGI